MTARATHARATSDYRAAPTREPSLRTHALPDPALMSPSARAAELGAILATGARRLRLSLDGSREPERDCPRMEMAP